MLELKVKNRTLFLKGVATYQTLKGFISEFSKYKKSVDVINTKELKEIDTLFLGYLVKLGKNLELTLNQEKLKNIVEANWKTEEKKKASINIGFIESVGKGTIDRLKEFYLFLGFVGEVFLNSVKILLNPKRIRIKSILHDVEIMGFKAVPILATISFLVGAVIAYHGSIKLKQFGANIFVVDLVSISVLRELGPLLVAILMAGRSASSYTAQIGIMKVTEEIDVIKTMGIDPLDVLVFPKIVSMFIVFPLLIVLSDVMGVFGGAVVGKLALDVTFSDFLLRLHHAIGIKTFLAGVLKAPAFAFLVATIGSFKGFRTQKNVESIGKSVTISVVDSIFAVIIADAIFSVLFRLAGV
ncbi:MlaE family ABC transporter permease [Hippea alviniae]|uniref:MlaE family ABC transporter permease n=1 Tax=Hippea alviniae TaxID=1279027 RepID=UPI0003B63382|nr:ABC transporter permease [Hippea alviniae]